MTDESRDDNSTGLTAPFKQFGEGWYRIIIALWFIVPLIVGLIGADDRELGALIIDVPIAIVSYYILVRMILWVYLGFKKS